MAVPASANYVFLPWVRQGAASGIQTPDRSANQPGVASLAIKLRVNNTAPDIERQVRLYGPGDVTGIDPQQVVRTEPRNLATDFEPNYFPAIEFDRPDFPWLFTPAKADPTGRLRPWLCLVVVRKQNGVSIDVDRNLPLPVLIISTPAQPARELPDLSESWAWAHAQITGTRRDAASLKASLAGDPALTLSRLLCPRRLDPLTQYLACVVPAFELGVKAGLGSQIQPADEKELKPAWASGAQSPPEIKLPVYFHWEFRTGAGGDFEELVRSLQSRPLPPGVGKRLMDISEPGFKITPPLPPGTKLEFEGALRVVDAPTTEWSKQTRNPFQTELKKILEAPGEAMKDERKEPVLAPPIYGSWQAARQTVQIADPPRTSATWLDELNLDPGQRAVAALGTQVVQTQQEQLMASAWEQLGEIQRINQLRRQAQLGRAVNGVYHSRHFAQFPPEALLKVLAPVQSRLVIAGTVNNRTTNMLLSRSIAESPIPARAVSAPLRRLTNPRGVVSTRFMAAGAQPITILDKLNTTIVVPPEKKQAGLVTLNQVTDAAPPGFLVTLLKQTVRFENASEALNTTPQLGDFKIVTEGLLPKRTLLDFAPELPDSPEAKAFRQAAKAHHDYLAYALMSFFVFFVPEQLKLAETKGKLIDNLDPEKTIKARVQASVGIASRAEPSGDPLEPILDAPDFPQPMYEAVRDLSQDFLFPGLEHVPPNSVALLETNPKFVESFLVGLSTEMARELLWRDYPTDQRGTYFQKFWDTSAGNARRDIKPIHLWDKNSKLGDNARAGDQLVLLLRGELLRRYPNSVIYAVAAVRKDGRLELSTAPTSELHPLFRGTLKPDVTFLGFDLTKEKATAEPGWFFVIQQQPTEPCFGMDVADFTKPLPPLTTWDNLSWRHLAKTEQELKELSHASIKTVLPNVDKGKWGRNAAHQAYITLQRPVRVAIHAKELILPTQR